MREPRDIALEMEKGVDLPHGDGERFSGYGVMGLPFRSGHLLALRRFPNASIGRGYTSVWHRRPDGSWVFIQDAPPQNACTRYFGRAVDYRVEGDIRIEWETPRKLAVCIDGDYSMRWEVSLTQNAVSRTMNAAAGWLPDRWWRSESVLKAFGTVGGTLMGSGRLNLTGKVPNGQRFVANPKIVWIVESTTAEVCGRSLGSMGALPRQANLADIWLPQNGRFFVGNVYMETFDPERHYAHYSNGPETSAKNLCFT